MATLQSLDPHTPMFAQFKEKTGPIVLANTFFVPKEPSMGVTAEPLHQGTAGSRLFLNVAIWESTEALAKALGNPQFQALSAEVPDDIVAYPHIFEKIDV